MKYDLANAIEQEAAHEYIDKLAERGKIVEVTRKEPNRTIPQNSYLHLLLGIFGLHFGYTIDESKILYKQMNKDLYYYRKKGRPFTRSSADLTKEEMAKSIDVFMQKSAEQGCELPLATDEKAMMHWENQIETNRRYL